MQLQLVATDADGFRPVYVGPDGWELPGFPGRTVPTELAVAAVTAAATLMRRAAADDPCWSVVHSGARLLGVTAQHFACAIGVVDCLIPQAPSVIRRRSRLWVWS